MIWWNGKSGDDFHVVVQRFPEVILPLRKNEKVSVPGRNGDILIQQDAFENVSQRYSIYISAEQTRLTPITHKIAEWLCVKGYQRLEDSYFLENDGAAAYPKKPSPFAAKPILVTSGSGEATITINDKTLELEDCNGITIDCELMQAHKDGVSKNGTVSGDFFELPEGESEITWTGGITGIKMKPRWFTI